MPPEKGGRPAARPPPGKGRAAVAVLHPDLGLGGAERLVVDEAAELAARGLRVVVYTAHHDPRRAFAETVAGAGGFEVRVRGRWFPRSVCGRCVALCAYVRGLLLALAIAWDARWRGENYGVVLVDQVAVANVALRAFAGGAHVCFYCHFPDLLLSPRGGWLKAAYRWPLDKLEEIATGLSHSLFVNSRYTLGVFHATFRVLSDRGVAPAVLHPAVRLPPAGDLEPVRGNARPAVLSINRFERKKDIGLAVEALGEVHRALKGQGRAGLPRLVLAGGYDERLPENVEHLRELQRLAAERGLAKCVAFAPSFSDACRAELLAECWGVLYTPQNEHFGIVPLEAMAARRPVVACNSGGPTESVADGVTGFLCDPRPAAFVDAMLKLLQPGVADALGLQARRHVEERFSRRAFGAEVYSHVVRAMDAE